MAERELSILVRAKGAAQAAGQIGKVDSAIGNLGRTAARGIRTAGANLARLGAVAAVGIGTQVAAGVRSLEELERVQNATAGVIESTGAKAGVTATQVRQLAESLEGLTTADDKVIQAGENLLLTFTNIGSDVFPQATKAMVDLGIAMAQGDVANADFKASAIQIGKALNDPIRGFTALRRVGVSFTKEQEAQIKKLVKAGDVLGAQKIILKELETEFGKAGEAAGKGFGADMRRVQDAIEGAQQALAVGFLPLISEIAGVLNEELAKPATLAKIREFGLGLAGGVRELIATAKGLPWGTIGDSLKIAGAGAKAVFDAFTAMPSWVQGAVLTGWGLNKLTGGALGTIVGELGKGLIKGVLGMNAGVVNINAARVNGGGPGGGGGGMGIFGALGVAGFVLTAAAIIGPEVRKWAMENGLAGTGANAGKSESQLAHERLMQEAAKNVGTLSKRATTGGLSPDERDEHNETQRKLEAVDDRLQAIRSKAADQKTAVDNSRIAIVAATRTGDSAVVAAIRALRLNITIPVTLSGLAGRQTTRVYSTGTTLSRYSGKLIPIE